ncbi:MAG: putative bifunctional diguanylate cyclase/phosphodiesterase [Chromatiales bacterium]
MATIATKSGGQFPRLLIVAEEPDNAVTHALCRVTSATPADDTFRRLEAVLFGPTPKDSPESTFELTRCQRAEEAVASVKAALADGRPYSLAFISVRDGVSAAEQIHALDPDINIVIVTGSGDVDRRKNEARLPPSDNLLYIQQPIDAHEIYHCAVALAAKWKIERKLRFHSGDLARLNGQLLKDISAREQAEGTLRLLHTAIVHTQDVTVIMTAAPDPQDSRIVYVNPAVSRVLGYSPQEAMGQILSVLFGPETDPAALERLRHQLIQGEAFAGQLCGLRKDASALVMDVRINPVPNEKGQITHYVALIRDVTEASRAAIKTAHQAAHDPLTGLPNRREFERRLALMVEHAREHGKQHALCYIDLDQFKVVNDTCGHGAGDELLRQISGILKSRLRERDTLARLGGDEFAVLLGECSVDQALRVANELREVIQDYRFCWTNRLFKVGASIGVVPFSKACTSSESLLSAADSACITAKEEGRNRVHLYGRETMEITQRHDEMQWIPRLHQALADNRFELYFQPIVPLGSAFEGMHGEILIRMIGEAGELILPSAFIPAAERYNQMRAIDHWIVCSTLSAISPVLPGALRVSINLSSQSISNPDFLQFVMDELSKHDVLSNQIIFEITETAAIINLNAAKSFITTLKSRGCRFALDDFGSGLSSFAYLKILPIDYLKIDGRFIQDITHDPVAATIVEAICRIGHVMGLELVAESVESQTTVEMLRKVGVNYGQGNGIAPPIPLRDAIKHLIPVETSCPQDTLVRRMRAWPTQASPHSV